MKEVKVERKRRREKGVMGKGEKNLHFYVNDKEEIKG